MSPVEDEKDHQTNGPIRAGSRGRGCFLVLLVDLYAGLLFSYLLLRVVGGGDLWFVEIISALAHWLLLLSFPLILFALYKKRWVALGMLAVSGAAFLWLYGGLFVPRMIRGSACERDQPAELQVMTYNLSSGIAPATDLIEVINHSGADIVALQEFTPEHVSILQAGFEDVYPYHILHGEGFSGIGLLSRYPITQHEIFNITSDRTYIEAVIKVDNRLLRVYSAHPHVAFNIGKSEQEGRREMEGLVQRIAGAENTILMGDFNFTDQNVGYQVLIQAGLVDVHRAAGWGFGSTYPKKAWSEGNRFPLVRIDYILVSDDFCPQRAWVGEDGGSDHLPVLARLSW